MNPHFRPGAAIVERRNGKPVFGDMLDDAGNIIYSDPLPSLG